MAKTTQFFRNLFKRAKPISPGIYHSQTPADSDNPTRLHLRIEPDGTGILIINAATVLHLNMTAAEYAYHIVRGTDPQTAVEQIAARYHVSKEQVKTDFEDVRQKIYTIIDVPDLDPVTYLGIERTAPYSGKITAPYRLDCAITYRLPDGSEAEAAPVKNVDRELTTDEWEQIIDTAWDAGIPHIVFTGGEPTLREDLPALIAKAETNGQVTGLLSNGLRLREKDYLQTLLQSGLDHLMMTLEPDNQQSWDALKVILPDDLYTIVHITVTPHIEDRVPDLLNRLASMGTNAISLSASSQETIAHLQDYARTVSDLHMDLIWDLPVPYSAKNPVAMETTKESLPDGAGRAWLYVEPDGDVLPAQGITRVLGNMLRDSWETIWKHALKE